MVDLASDKEYADALANAVGAPLPVVSENFSPLSSGLSSLAAASPSIGKVVSIGGLLSRAGTESCGGLHCKVVWAMCAPFLDLTLVLTYRWQQQ